MRLVSHKDAHRNLLFCPEKPRISIGPKAPGDPERVHRLMFAASLAYLWVIYLATVAQEDDWLPLIHRSHRCDLSLFQLGLRLLNYLLNHDQPIPSSFALEPETVR